MGTHRNRASLCAIAALIFATFAGAQQTSKSSDAPKQGQGGGGTSDIQRETEQYPVSERQRILMSVARWRTWRRSAQRWRKDLLDFGGYPCLPLYQN